VIKKKRDSLGNSEQLGADVGMAGDVARRFSIMIPARGPRGGDRAVRAWATKALGMEASASREVSRGRRSKGGGGRHLNFKPGVVALVWWHAFRSMHQAGPIGEWLGGGVVDRQSGIGLSGDFIDKGRGSDQYG